MNKLIVLEQINPRFCSEMFDQVVELDNETPPHEELFKDAIVLYGVGNDINPELYGEARWSTTQRPDIRRDTWEKYLFDEFKTKVKGFIGVCRGAQMLTALNGGRLLQHVRGHCNGDHTITTQDGQQVVATSLHHQMCWPFDLPASDYELVAWSTDNLTGQPIAESEVLWYPKTKSLCIQGHPEFVNPRNPYPVYCRKLIQEYLNVK